MNLDINMMTGIKKTWGLKSSIILLRIIIGWHFLYEGIVKLYSPDWTSFGYLASAQGPFKSVFRAMADTSVVGWIDGLNMAALIVVGLTLILGFFEKFGALIAIGLLAMYYLVHPSFPWLTQINVEGSYWFVNKNLIELVACIVIFNFPTGKYFGLACILKRNKEDIETENT